MLPSHGDFRMRQEQYQDLLREAEKERLIQTAKLQPSSKWGLPQQAAHWLGTYVVKWGLKLQAHSSSTPTCCGDGCLVELRANVRWVIFLAVLS
jgi:hypothetical protein